MEHSSELIASVKAGDLQAFGVLYDRYGRLVRAICYDRLHNQADAEDLAQEVFLRAFCKVDQLRQPERFGQWLVGITRSMSTDWLRKNHSKKRPTTEPFFDQQVTDTNEALLGRVDDLHLAIAQLAERERLAIHIFYLAEQPAAIAQEVLELSSSGFYKLLERARQQLASYMSTHEGVRQ